MKNIVIYLTIICSIFFSSCSKNLSSIQNKPAEQIATDYAIIKDLPYATDRLQKMDIYLSKEAASFGKHKYTIVFLHGGGYYFSDKSDQELYIQPYLEKGLNVINMNYRLKKGVPIATSDLTIALNFLKANNSEYNLNLENIIVTGFSAGAHIATNVGFSQNNPGFPNKLKQGILITGIINFSGSVDRQDIIEKTFIDSDIEVLSTLGKALYPSEGYEVKDVFAAYEPITYFDAKDPPLFLWQGGMDDQILPETYDAFVPLLRKGKEVHIFVSDGQHSPTQDELINAYVEIFSFLDDL